jgi:hypothetical protein
MNVIIKVFDASDGDPIDAEQGRLHGLGYAVRRLRADQGLDWVDETINPASEQSFDDVVVLVATA